MLLHQLLNDTVRTMPNQEAIVADGQRLTYAQLNSEVNQLVSLLKARGLQQGDRVILFMDNSLALAVGIWAVLKAGGVILPVHGSTKAERLRYLIEDAQPTMVLTQGVLLSIVAAVSTAALSVHTVLVQTPQDLPNPSASLVYVAWPAPIDVGVDDVRNNDNPIGLIDQDLAALIYTSGSTGEPKGVMLSHLNMRSACSSILSYLPLQSSDRILCTLPLCFSYGLYHLFLAAAVGATLYIERAFTFPVKMAELMLQERITVFPAVPTMYAMLLQLKVVREGDGSCLRLLTNAGSALPLEHVRMIAQVWPHVRVYNMYGLTECARVSYLPSDDLESRPGSVGKGMSNQACWLVNDDGVSLPAGSTGELVVRGSHVMRGYWRKPQATADRLRSGSNPGELVLYTGDLFRSDAQGYLYFVARRDDIIKTRGEKVSPKEVEDAIHTLAAVRQVAVVGVSDSVLGQAIKAFVVCDPSANLTEREVIRHCLSRMESFKAPQSVAFVEALPHTDSGKILKRHLF